MNTIKMVIEMIWSKLRVLVFRLRAMIFDVYALKSYSQEGEDMILRRIFEDKRDDGFFVDVGAHHPKRFSNTFFFYRRGWRGINIEPNPAAFRAFLSARSRDINLQMGVSDCAGELTYYSFDEPALNSFDGEIVKGRLAARSCKLIGTSTVPVERLDSILGRHLQGNQEIDFLSIDVEGLDLAVLRSNDWRTFRPKYVLAEALKTSLEQAMHSDVSVFMTNQGYELFAKTFNTLVFRRN